MDATIFVLFGLVFVYLFFRFCQNWRPEPWPEGHFEIPKWQAHRGLWTEKGNENTIEAFREAKKRGLKMVELDVQLTKDGVPLVFHDEDLKRLLGRAEKIKDLTLVEIQKLLGAPTLEQVLKDEECGPFFNIEIKSQSATDQALAKKVAECVRKTQTQRQVIFSSFNPLALRALYKELPEVPRALLVTEDPTDPDNAFYLKKMWLGGYCRAQMVNLDKKMVNPRLLKRLTERKVPYALWTVNDPKAGELFIQNGAVSIISDHPPL